MKERWTEGLAENCPDCNASNLPYFGNVLKNDDLFLQYECSGCGRKYIRRDEAPTTVEVWHSPGRPRK